MLDIISFYWNIISINGTYFDTENYRSAFVTLPLKTIAYLVLKVLTYIITSITAHLIRLAAILARMPVLSYVLLLYM